MALKEPNCIINEQNLVLPRLKIREDIDDNSKIIFLFLNKNIYCDPLLEPSRRGGSNGGSQNMFLFHGKI